MQQKTKISGRKLPASLETKQGTRKKPFYQVHSAELSRKKKSADRR